ncbi:MAG: helix-turn-helix domain-containing protein [Candidatus Micrarchaeota archaeon]
MAGVFSPKSCRIVSYLLLHAKTAVSQKQIVEATGVSKGLASKVVSELVQKGLVKRPYRTRFSLEYPEKLLLDWIGKRNIGAKKAFFAKDASVLKEVKHAHTIFSGALLDSGYLESGTTTAYVASDFRPSKGMLEGRLDSLKTKIALIPAEDEFVFYGKRRVGKEVVVNPFLLYVDLASFGGLALTALERVAEKHGFPSLKSGG